MIYEIIVEMQAIINPYFFKNKVFIIKFIIAAIMVVMPIDLVLLYANSMPPKNWPKERYIAPKINIGTYFIASAYCLSKI